MGVVLRVNWAKARPKVGSSFCSTWLSTRVLSLASKKCCHVGIHVIPGTHDLGPRVILLPTTKDCIDWPQVTWDLGLGNACEPTLKGDVGKPMHSNTKSLTILKWVFACWLHHIVYLYTTLKISNDEKVQTHMQWEGFPFKRRLLWYC